MQQLLDVEPTEFEPEEAPRSAVLLTGASSGIGRATVLRLARRGGLVFAGVRRREDGDALVRDAGPNVRPVILEVTSEISIAAARAQLEAQPGLQLDGIVNNAGIAVAAPLEILPLPELRRQFEVNFFGAIAVTQAFLPLLRRTRGRVVNVSSIQGKFAAPFVGAYAASKFALEGASDALRLELRPFGVRVILIEPGAVKTPIWSRSSEASLAMLAGLPSGARLAYEGMIEKVTRVAAMIERQGTEPERVAAVIEHALFALRPRARYLVGTDARIRLAITRLPEWLRDRIIARVIGIDPPPRD